MTQAPALHRPATLWLPILQEALACEGSFRWHVRGGSMAPTIPAGSEVEIVPLPGKVRRGMIVVFVGEGDVLVVHRLVHRTHQGAWIAQGDNRRTPDRPVAPAKVVGAAESVWYEGRRLWPQHFSEIVAILYIFRYHLYRMARFALRLRNRTRWTS